MSLFQGAKNTCTLGQINSSVPTREVSLIQECLLEGVPMYIVSANSFSGGTLELVGIFELHLGPILFFSLGDTKIIKSVITVILLLSLE